MKRVSGSESQTMTRTGPIGRVARLGLAGAFAAPLASIVGPRGPAQFRNPHILGEPVAWFIHTAMLVTFIILVGALAAALGGRNARRRWQLGAVIALVAAVGSAAVIGKTTQGAIWGFPLADLVWWFDVLNLIQLFVAEILAIALGTPGCEIGVWSELLARAGRGTARSEDVLACVFGLHLLDGWEARRRTAVRG